MNSSYKQHTIVHPDAQVGKNVTIGPFTFIDKDVVIGDDTWIGPNVTIFSGARIGKGVQIHPGAVVSGTPQDLKFNGEVTTAEIGDGTIVREYVTINRGTSYANKTVVGKNCLLMAYAHIAHDCILGDHVILANNVTLAGHVEIQDWAILEGLAAVQQFTRIGQHSFIAGGSLVRKSVPPYVRAAREPLSYVGVNKVGLSRRNFSQEQINNIHDIYRIMFVKGYNLSNALEEVESSIGPSPEKDNILDFIRSSQKTGILRGFNQINGSELYED
ncbi:MAG: acyl-ACP--UDP-N-acetylglucosamine O-acyltransferase [Lewinella sp.]|jgi:UDP-N-acetylglucosamine acyltransferase|uniref:acyl-ACP--UDP-N-acetylglucosamine O-acyltransferase n=1 Tax=Lewinella sp. TaxID=2004506 RepID=UPI003D6B744A